MDLGSIGSDLYRDTRDGPGENWSVTDRGPNGNVEDKGTFGPRFDPTVVYFRTKAGDPVTGMPNVPVYDDALRRVGEKVLTDNPNGLVAADGHGDRAHRESQRLRNRRQG